MAPSALLLLLLVLSFWAYLFASRQAMLHSTSLPHYSMPMYTALYVSFTGLFPASLLWLLGQGLQQGLQWWLVPQWLQQQGLAASAINLEKVFALQQMPLLEVSAPLHEVGARLAAMSQLVNAWLTSLCLLALGLGWLRAWRRWRQGRYTRVRVEHINASLIHICGWFALAISLGIIITMLAQSYRFFSLVSWWQFWGAFEWRPNSLEQPLFGVWPLLIGSCLIALIALAVAVPIGLMVAIYLSEYAAKTVRYGVRPLIEVLAGVPTVVYGFVAILVVAPMMQQLGQWFGLQVSGESALASGLVLGVMLIPFVSSLSTDVFSAVPQALRDASFALGATPAETACLVVFPAALPGVLAAILLAASRAMGETMIVVMASGLVAKLSINPLDAVTTMTAQIVALLTGDQAFDSPQTLAAFALGLVLLLVTLVMNIVALRVGRHYRAKLLGQSR